MPVVLEREVHVHESAVRLVSTDDVVAFRHAAEPDLLHSPRYPGVQVVDHADHLQGRVLVCRDDPALTRCPPASIARKVLIQ